MVKKLSAQRAALLDGKDPAAAPMSVEYDALSGNAIARGTAEESISDRRRQHDAYR